MSVLLAAGLGILAAPAAASFPGANGEIAFTRSAPKLGGVDATTHLIEPTGRRERAISCSVPGRAHGVCGDYGPSFSPDGDWLLVINPDAGSGSPNHRLRIMRADGVDPRAVPLPVFPEAATWSPDGRQIAFSAPSPETQRQELFVVDVDGSDLRRTVGGATNPAWSSRGRIAFVRDRAGGAAPDIYVVRPRWHRRAAAHLPWRRGAGLVSSRLAARLPASGGPQGVRRRLAAVHAPVERSRAPAPHPSWWPAARPVTERKADRLCPHTAPLRRGRPERQATMHGTHEWR